MTLTTPAANDAAAAYQRLRSHLAYLKLPAAAEALPGILDAARDQHLTVLDALERLLGTEAAAAEERKDPGRPSPKRRLRRGALQQCGLEVGT